jgi:cell division protease FtsH
MVTKYGMSEKIGVLALESSGGRALFGKGVEENVFSEKLSSDVDGEVARIMDEAYKKAENVVKTHKPALDAIARRLIEVENIEREEYESIIVAHGIQLKKKLDIEHSV